MCFLKEKWQFGMTDLTFDISLMKYKYSIQDVMFFKIRQHEEVRGEKLEQSTHTVS